MIAVAVAESTRRVRASRLRWRCRRGTLELDLRLDRLCARRAESMNEAEISAWESLLDADDGVVAQALADGAAPCPSIA